MAALNALSMVFNIAPIQIGAGQIDGIQKFLDGCAVFDLKLGTHMLDRNFQAPHHIAVFFNSFQVSWYSGFSATSFQQISSW